MLILTRRPGEAIMVGNEVQVRVVGVKGNQVRIGVTAPPRIRVDREEIYLRNLERERRSALAPDRRLTGARVEGFELVGTVPAPARPAIAASSKDRIGDPLTPLHARGEGGTRGTGG